MDDGTLEITSYSETEDVTEISIPSIIDGKTVTNIGDSAFSGCSMLKDVYYIGSEAQWENMDISFGNDALFAATIHYGLNTSEESDDNSADNNIDNNNANNNSADNNNVDNNNTNKSENVSIALHTLN